MALGDIRLEFGKSFPKRRKFKETVLGPLFKARLTENGIEVVADTSNIPPNEWFAFYNDGLVPASELDRGTVEELRSSGQVIAYDARTGTINGTVYEDKKKGASEKEILTYRRYEKPVSNMMFQHALPASGIEGHEVDPNPILDIEKGSESAFDIKISEFEQLFQILPEVEEIKKLAAQEGADPEDIGWLAYAIYRSKSLTFPHSISRVPTLDSLSQVLNYKAETYIHSLIAVWKNADGDLNTISLQSEFSELDDVQRQLLLHLLRKINSLAKGWKGIQRHYFEQMFRDWLYFALHGPTPTLEYFTKKYSCKSDYEIKCIFNCIYASIVPDGKRSDSIDAFVRNFKYFICSFVPEGNAYLLPSHIAAIWGSDVLEAALDRLKDDWVEKFGEIGIDLTNIFEIETPSLSELVRDGKVPAEMLSEPTIDELRIVNRIYFPNGLCIQVRAILDRVDLMNRTIDDWKTRYRDTEELSYTDRLQNLLQQLCFKGLLNQKKYPVPMDRNGYRYCSVRTFVRRDNIGEVLSDLPAFNDRPLEYPKDAFPDGIVTHKQSVSEAIYFISALERILEFLIAHRDIMHKAIKYQGSVGSIPSPKLVDPARVAEQKEEIEAFTHEPYIYLEA